MLDTAVWGSGDTEDGRFKANKAIASANIEEVAGGILVNWGGDDQVILSGETWKQTPIYGGGFYRWNFEHRIVGNNSGYLLRNWTASAVHSGIEPVFRSEAKNCGGNVSVYKFFAKGTRVQWVTLCGEIQYQTNSTPGSTSFDATFTYTAGGNEHYSIQVRNLRRTLVSGVESIVGYRITSVQTGQATERMTTTAPTVTTLTAGCHVVITHEDTEVIEIPLNYCPAWVNLLDSQACPAGSCECIHDGHKCCYDSNTGELIKAIQL